MKKFNEYVKYFLLFCSLLMPSQVFMDDDLAPWFTRQFEIRSSATYSFRSCTSIASKNASFREKLQGSFFDFKASIPIIDWSLGTKLLFANTTKRKFGIDHFRSDVRYQIMDDTAGFNAFSLVVGSSIAFASKAALNDPISFHHGRLENEYSLSIGKELESGQFWSSRLWGAFILGIADVGSPWAKSVLAFEKNDSDSKKIGIYLLGLTGFGKNRFSKKHFHGYGPINHKSLDLSVRYTHALESNGELYFEYTRRLYAYNFPKNFNSFSFSFIYPFGI